MLCSKCGNELNDNDVYCFKCGAKVHNDSVNTIRLTCQNCGSSMTFDNEKQIIACPYCGSKELIPESDNVKIERIKSESALSQMQMSYDIEMKKQQLAEEKRQRKNKENLKLTAALWGFIVLCFFVIWLILKFGN